MIIYRILINLTPTVVIFVNTEKTFNDILVMCNIKFSNKEHCPSNERYIEYRECINSYGHKILEKSNKQEIKPPKFA